MKNIKVAVEILEQSDFVFTPDGRAEVVTDEVFSDRHRTVMVKFTNGDIRLVDRDDCIFDM
jgi:hypothetical protein